MQNDPEPATITHLWRWPVKGLGGQALDSVTVTPGALFPFDRAFALENGPSNFDATNPKHIAKRHFACLVHQPDTARLGAHYSEADGTLTITTLDGEAFTIDPAAPEALEGKATQLIEQGLRGPLKLRMADDLASGHGFTDVPERWISIQNQASITKLEKAAGASLDPVRLRTNILLEGWEAFAEETLVGRTLKIGGALVDVIVPINRCRAIDVNPATAAQDQQLVRALMGMNGQPSLGLYARVVEGGQMAPGDSVALT